MAGAGQRPGSASNHAGSGFDGGTRTPGTRRELGGALRIAHGTDYLTRRTQGKGIVNSKSRGISNLGVVTLARPGVRAGVILLRSREVQVIQL